MLLKAILVGIGGFAGAIARFGINELLKDKIEHFQLGTLAVNLLGSFLLSALLFGVFQPRLLSHEYKLLLTVGFCGSLTTMSTFAVDFFELSSASHIIQAIVYLLLNVLGCIFMVWLAKAIFT
ncbi:MAG: fluoride efflux transporter CrcB [Bacteroidia bacterium]